MTVANVVMFEFDTPEELKGWAQQYGKSGPFPNNIISLFVQTGVTSAIGINTYPCLSPVELCQYILAKGVRKHGSEALF